MFDKQYLSNHERDRERERERERDSFNHGSLIGNHIGYCESNDHVTDDIT